MCYAPHRFTKGSAGEVADLHAKLEEQDDDFERVEDEKAEIERDIGATSRRVEDAHATLASCKEESAIQRQRHRALQVSQSPIEDRHAADPVPAAGC